MYRYDVGIPLINAMSPVHVHIVIALLAPPSAHYWEGTQWHRDWPRLFKHCRSRKTQIPCTTYQVHVHVGTKLRARQEALVRLSLVAWDDTIDLQELLDKEQRNIIYLSS